MLENLSSLFESFIAKVDGKDKVLNHMLWAQLDEMLPSLRKFRKLAGMFSFGANNNLSV